ncbi:C1 family peptidase [Nocardia terpenica]|uniref:Peptidase n=1 Tax=Nocardia terpenica TaxID=455432 RepID=A0A291RKV4_9NOCA|nr:C1 family peptidase [Nocardia terpenica]ATL67920.1 peptidase [Nocardia terpenica]
MRYSCLPTAFAFALGVGLVSAGFANAAPAPSAPAPVLKQHAFGLDWKAAKAAQSHDTSSGTALPVLVGRNGAPPDSYSLEQYTQSPGNQGQVGSCVTWATGYSAYGVIMNEQNIGGGPMAPMYIYSQIAQGNDTGTYASVAIPMEEQQGIDTKSDYTQGDFDYTTQPTDAERANAAHYKLSGSQDLINSGDRQQAIEQAISTGMPVPIGFEVRQSFESLNSSNYNYNPDPSEQVLGGHEVTIVAYDQTGVTIENSWGTGWGNSGFFTAPWSWINSSDVDEIHSMGRLVTE